MLERKAIEPLLFFDSAVKINRPEICKMCILYFQIADQLRVWRRLRSSVVHGFLEIVQMLVNHGTPTRTLEPDSDPLKHAAIANNRVDIIQFLLSLGLEFTETDSDGSTPFLLACKCQNARAVEFLLAQDSGLSTSLLTAVSTT